MLLLLFQYGHSAVSSDCVNTPPPKKKKKKKKRRSSKRMRGRGRSAAVKSASNRTDKCHKISEKLNILDNEQMSVL